MRNEAAFARLCGVAPLEASSGKVTRHRLNQGGNRQANHAPLPGRDQPALLRPRTKRYVERRTKEGKSIAKIVRVLKRYVAQEASRLGPVGGEAQGDASGPFDEPSGGGYELGAEVRATVSRSRLSGSARSVVQRTRLWAKTAQASQAPLAEKCPEGTSERPAPCLRSRTPSSTTAC